MSVIGPDISFYQNDNATLRKIDFLRMKNKDVEFVIVRAGQNLWPDPDFAYNWQTAKSIGLPRGSYWYYDSRIEPKAQAELWLDTLAGDLGELPLFADIEETYNGAYKGCQNWRIFLEHLKTLTGHEIGIYTGYYYFKDNVPEAEKDYFKQYPLWIATYGVAPLVPPPWTNWLFWQYTDTEDGIAYGAESAHIDMNMFNGDAATFRTRFHLAGAVPNGNGQTELHSVPFPGVSYHRVQRFNSWCHVTRITGGKWHVTNFGPKRVSEVAKEVDAQVVTNGGDFSAFHATGLHASEGLIYRTQSEYEPWVNFTITQAGQINAFDSREAKFNALAGKRFIVLDGKLSTRTSAAWLEVHPRTLAGVCADGTVILCVVDGRQDPYSTGVNLFDAASIMIEFGAQKAIDLDGGGSSAMWVKDRIVNSPIEGGMPGQERLVGDHIVWFSGEAQPVPPRNGDSMNYKVVTACKPRKTPSMYELVTLPNLAIGLTFASTVTQTINDTSRVDHGVTFVQMQDGYWVPLAYKGVMYVQDVTVVTPAPVSEYILYVKGDATRKFIPE